MRRTLLAALAMTLALPPAAAVATEPAAQGAAAQQEQLRGFWVDAFNPGIYDAQQVATLVDDARAANANALFVQVGRRFDCFCNEALYPRTDAAIAPAPYDPLAEVIEQAHAAGIEVHAWINATTLWNLATPPRSADHAFNTNGPSAEGAHRWLNRRVDGTELVGNNAYIDPGNPAAVDYVVAGVRSIIDNYDVDGVNFDYIRYPDFNAGEFQNDWGYTEVALARFQDATGRTDVPAVDDPEWSDWRRAQVTNLVRKLYLGAHASDPDVAVSVNATTYAFGPPTYGGWEGTRPYTNVLQDWRAWMEEGIVDLNVAMNYKRNWLDDQARMFDEWTDALADFQYDRHAVNGPALYLNDVEDSIAQVRRTFVPSPAGNTVAGWSGYSYANASQTATASSATATKVAERDALIAALTTDDPEGDIPVFAEPAAVPDMPWKSAPTTGHLAGEVTLSGDAADQVEVTVRRLGPGGEPRTALTDGSGWFGAVDLPPGRYQVRVDGPGIEGPRNQVVTVTAGSLTEVRLQPVAP
ncbi:glycoside hydrolase family 10 protein [Egicoccus sp. AB-alg2]|uniref:glycoside hydrolase family 10 protein n=1 Tax=Egicoccus sp. AB-alg2 TaxID=3242693 RepID=UPI00359EBD71